MTNNKQMFLTPEGLAELKTEHEELTKVRRPQIVERVSAARDMGDLSENAEYTAAREELAFIDGRIDELEELLKHVTIIDDTAKAVGGGKIGLGSKVTVHHHGKKEIYTVVGEWEADPLEKKISHQSPLGQALLGKIVGEKVDVEAPAGKITYTVVAVE